MAANKGNIGHMGFGGYDASRREGFAFLETLGGGSGGRSGKDGMEAVQCDLSNTENAPVEEMEINYPVRVLRYGLIPDSAGAGKWRGGLGIVRDYQFPSAEAISVTVFSDRAKFPPWGLFGGKDACPARFFLRRTGQSPQALRSKCLIDVGADDVVSFETPGGGGYGDPLERDPGLVARDVRLGKVSREHAERDYGVVLDGNGEPDAKGTRALRDGIRTRAPGTPGRASSKKIRGATRRSAYCWMRTRG
ncbi:MAG: hydantoinase B/oxoprolinase family protein, partial [Candidatus Eisenbacteria bacterium]|nr:hydantoinase B/oxoprolinase family protein [Candidatus Eisenbacteria bacterium]